MLAHEGQKDAWEQLAWIYQGQIMLDELIVITFRWLTLWMWDVDYDYLNSNKTFNAVSQSVLVAKQEKYGLDRWTTKWMETWLDYQA